MKNKLCSIICLCSFVSIMLCACGRNEDVTDISDGLQSENDWNTKMVMVDDMIYLDTGYEKEADKRPDTFEGVINSEVDRREKPTVNDQSNFGTGYGFRYGQTEGIIEVYMNDKWQVFATEKIIAGDKLILDEQLAEQTEDDKMWDRIPMVRVNYIMIQGERALPADVVEIWMGK